MQWTITEACPEWGIDEATLKKRLRARGYETPKGKRYTTREITNGIVGSLEVERIRLTRAESELKEMEAAIKRGDSVLMSQVEKWLVELFLPVRQRLLALPSEMSARCNPSDPMLAFESLQMWVDESLKILREQLPKPPNGEVSSKELENQLEPVND